MAVSGITYVFVLDIIPTDPQMNSAGIQFANYNEGMSYAKWLSKQTYLSSERANVYVWNYNGGSGFWNNQNFTPLGNTNWTN